MTTAFTGAGVSVYRYRMLISALQLEKKGLRHSGGSIRPRIASELGLSPRQSRDVFIDKLNAKLQEALQQVADGQGEISGSKD